VVIEGLTLDGTQSSFNNGAHGLRVDACGGQVWIQDCQILGGADAVSDRHAVYVTDSDQVPLVRCAATGTSSPVTAIPHLAAGLRAIDSRVFAWESEFNGGIGGDGAHLDGGTLFAEGSVLRGGEGYGVGNPSGVGCQLAINGGNGVEIGTGGIGTVVDTHLLGGAADPDGCSSNGFPAWVFFAGLTQLPGPSVAFAVESPLADGATSTLTFEGQPGDLPVVLMATAVAPVTYLPKFTGAIATGSPVLFFLAPLPGSGSVSVPFGFGDALPPGTGSTIFLQGAVLKAAGGALLADPAALTTYDG